MSSKCPANEFKIIKANVGKQLHLLIQCTRAWLPHPYLTMDQSLCSFSLFKCTRKINFENHFVSSFICTIQNNLHWVACLIQTHDLLWAWICHNTPFSFLYTIRKIREVRHTFKALEDHESASMKNYFSMLFVFLKLFVRLESGGTGRYYFEQGPEGTSCNYDSLLPATKDCLFEYFSDTLCALSASAFPTS